MKYARIFTRMSAREQVMLGALMVVGILIWGSILMRQWEQLSARHKQVQGEFDKQAIWLRDADRFEAELQKSLSILHGDETIGPQELVTFVDELARKQGLTHDLGSIETDANTAFVRHALKVGVKNAKLTKLIDFERGLQERYPYAAIDDFTISANKSDPRMLNVRLTIVSYQYAPKSTSP
jgi:hypothetical protein